VLTPSSAAHVIQNASTSDIWMANSAKARAFALTDAWPNSLTPTRRWGRSCRPWVRQRVVLGVSLRCRAVFKTRDTLVPHLIPYSHYNAQLETSSVRSFWQSVDDRDMSHRNSWETFRECLIMLALCMILEPAATCKPTEARAREMGGRTRGHG